MPAWISVRLRSPPRKKRRTHQPRKKPGSRSWSARSMPSCLKSTTRLSRPTKIIRLSSRQKSQALPSNSMMPTMRSQSYSTRWKRAIPCKMATKMRPSRTLPRVSAASNIECALNLTHWRKKSSNSNKICWKSLRDRMKLWRNASIYTWCYRCLKRRRGVHKSISTIASTSAWRSLMMMIWAWLRRVRSLQLRQPLKNSLSRSLGSETLRNSNSG